MPSKYFYSFIFGTTLGVFIESLFNFGYPFGLLCLLASLVVILVSSQGMSRAGVFLVSLFFLGGTLGVLRVDVYQMNTFPHALDSFLGRTSEINGIVVSEPDVREKYTNIVFEARNTPERNNGNNLPHFSRILLRTPVYPEIRYGDEITVIGKITTPQNFTNDSNGKVFDYRAYLAKDEIFYEMYFPKIAVVAHQKGNIIKEKLLTFKNWLVKNIVKNISEPEAALGAGITLGAKQSLGEEWIKKFRETGLAHIVVLSGYNIAVVASVIARAVSFFPFTARLIATALGIVLFAVMVGAEATVMRATLMALVVIFLRAISREGEALRVLLFAGWGMILLNPMILIHDVSFQLSFMATLSLVVFVPLVEKYFQWIPQVLVREILVTTIATQIFVAPILLYQMGSVSLSGIITNLFVLPVVPLVMLLVSLVALFAWVPIFVSIVALGAQILLSYILLIATLGSKISFSSIHLKSFGVWMLIIAYAVIFAVCFFAAQNEKTETTQ